MRRNKKTSRETFRLKIIIIIFYSILYVGAVLLVPRFD